MTIDMNDISDAVQYEPTHPGEILLHEFMEPIGMSRNALSRCMHVPLSRISKIISGQRKISADTALRLSLVFQSTTPKFWLGLQNTCDLLAIEAQEEQIKKEVTPYDHGTDKGE